MAYNIDETVECPFYTGDMNKPLAAICCEGATEDGHIKLCFKNKDDKLSYKDKFCRRSKRWFKCPVSIGLESKYE